MYLYHELSGLIPRMLLKSTRSFFLVVLYECCSDDQNEEVEMGILARVR
jgi:hypothetical protein